jgi:purine-binding chemotaxis protein CheW
MTDIDEKVGFDTDLLEDEEDEDTQQNKYITFKLADEDYAIEIRYVNEIIGIQKITHVPDMPFFIKGIINLRGRVIPILNVRLRFSMPEIEYNERTCIIVITINESIVGLIVDEVSEVLDILPNQIDDALHKTKSSNSRFIQGIGKIGDSVKIILNVEKILSEEELSKFSSL